MAAITVDGLAGQICADIQLMGNDGEFPKEITLGPEPGVILTTWSDGQEFTIIVKEG